MKPMEMREEMVAGEILVLDYEFERGALGTWSSSYRSVLCEMQLMLVLQLKDDLIYL